MKSLTQRVAEFCKRPGGATGSEIAEHFNISAEDAKSMVWTIRKAAMYSVDEGMDGHRIRIRVTEIRKPTRKSVAVIAKNIITGEEYRFESLAEAESRGGFCRDSIRRCLSGKQHTHAGYYWKLA